jgi:hypothetical protein
MKMSCSLCYGFNLTSHRILQLKASFIILLDLKSFEEESQLSLSWASTGGFYSLTTVLAKTTIYFSINCSDPVNLLHLERKTIKPLNGFPWQLAHSLYLFILQCFYREKIRGKMLVLQIQISLGTQITFNWPEDHKLSILSFLGIVRDPNSKTLHLNSRCNKKWHQLMDDRVPVQQVGGPEYKPRDCQ